MERIRYPLREELAVHKLITFYYREMPRQFQSGESHDFWEFNYIDKGEVDVVLDTKHHLLGQGDIVFIKPNAFHGVRPRNGSAPNLIIVSFECSDPCMMYLEDQVFRLEDEDKSVLSSLIKEGLESFDPPIDSPFNMGPRTREDAPFGCEQLVRNHLEHFLIRLIRKRKPQSEVIGSFHPLESSDHDLIASIVDYMNRNIARNLSFDKICSTFSISPTRLKLLFKEKTGYGVMAYYNRLKIDHAKQLIREGANKNNFTEIAERLGYSSLHYFSKQFKKATDMTLTEYGQSISYRAGRAQEMARKNRQEGSP